MITSAYAGSQRRSRILPRPCQAGIPLTCRPLSRPTRKQPHLRNKPKHGKVGCETYLTRRAKETPPLMARSPRATTARKTLVAQAEKQAGSRMRTKARQDKPTLATRISYHTNERLSHANETTGLGISGIVEAALRDYFD